MKKKMRIGILGSGTIGGFVIDAIKDNKIENAEVVVACGRSEKSKGREKVRALGIPWITNPGELLNWDLDVVVESASHESVELYGEKILKAGINLIPMSLGALVDQDLLNKLIDATDETETILHIPSGGIGGLDALQAAVIGGANKVTMISRKKPVAWKDIPYVEAMNLDLDNMDTKTLLFEGPASECVKEFPKNINIAAALSLAGIGFDKTIIKMYADPDVEYNTHEISCEAESGKIHLIFENVPVPTYPRTTYLACLSAVAALKRFQSGYRIGT